MTAGEALGRAVVIHRTVKGHKRKELASMAGISYPFMSEIETGMKEPSLTVLRRVAWALDLELSVLIRDAERVERGESLLGAL